MKAPNIGHFSLLTSVWYNKKETVKAPNIAHLSFLTSVEYNKKETNLKKCAQPNKVIIILYLHRVQNEKYFPDP